MRIVETPMKSTPIPMPLVLFALLATPPWGCFVGDADDEGTSEEADSWDPEFCAPPSALLTFGTLDGHFCAPPCMADPDCPTSAAGTHATCSLATREDEPPSYCALLCELDTYTCPAGSTCKDLMDPMHPGVGLCTFP
jgi:hypothetical protein